MWDWVDAEGSNVGQLCEAERGMGESQLGVMLVVELGMTEGCVEGVGGLWRVTPASCQVLPKSLCHSSHHLDKGEKIECVFQCWDGEWELSLRLGYVG